MGIFDLYNKKGIISTFQNDFDKIRTAEHAVQVDVATRIYSEIQLLTQLDVEVLKSVLPQLRDKYKKLRNDALKNGGSNELDADYASAALLESVALAVGNDELFGKIMNDLMGWFSYLGIIKRS